MDKKLYATLDIYGQKIKLQIIRSEESGYSPKCLGRNQIKIKRECILTLVKGKGKIDIKVKKETLDKILDDFYGEKN